MPWKVFKDGGQFCVHKQNSDGSKGEKVACHPDEEKANAQLRALYANAKEAMPPELNITEERRADVSDADKKRAEKEYGNVEYADPENKKYPIDPKHVHAAWNYINKAKNAAKYSAAKVSKMKSRIAAAFKRATGHVPPSAEKEAVEGDEPNDDMMELFDYLASQMDESGGCPICGCQMKDGKCTDCGHDMNSDAKEAMTTSEMPQAMMATEHEHEHMHGTLTHSHKHQHDREHGIDGQMGKHDHPHPDEENPAEDKGETAKDEKEEDKKAKKESVRTMVFGESVSLKESAVDKAHKTIDVTLIRPGWSMNHRYYSREALARAVGIFEGTKAFADHPSKFEDENRPERSVTDITGYYTNVRQAEDGSLRATRHFIGKKGDEVYQLALAAIDKPDLMGLSINAMGKTKIGEAEGQTGVIVEDLVKSFSVDDVTVASAGGKYEKLMQSGDEMTVALLRNLTYEEWRSVNPEFEARIKKEMRTARKEELTTEALKEVAEKETVIKTQGDEIEKLKESLSGLEKTLADKERESASRVSELTADLKLTISKLPKDWCESLRPNLLGKADAEMDKLIEAERKKFFSNKEPIDVKDAGVSRTKPEDLRDPKQDAVLEALGVRSEIVPLDAEDVNQYLARKKQSKR